MGKYRLKPRLFLFFVLAPAIALTYQNCAPVHEGDMTLGSLSAGLPAGVTVAQSLTAFTNTLYPTLQQNCAACHGVSQIPMFAVADSQTSQDTLLSLGLVNLQDPASSRLVQKILGGHNNFPTSLANQVQQNITDWAAQLIAAGGGSGGGGVLPPPPVLEATFTSISNLILTPKCVGCHGPTQAQSGYRYDTYTNVMKSVVAGNAGGSKLYTITSSGEMPTGGGAKLTTDELNAIATWINNGAPNN